MLKFRLRKQASSQPVTRCTHRAFGLLDASIALIIAAMAITAGARYYTQYLDNQISRGASDQMKSVSASVAKYTQDNYGEMLSDVDAGGGIYHLDLNALKPVYLTPDFSGTNAFGQAYQVVLRRPTPGVNKLDTLIYTTGGTEVENREGLAISQMMGQGGGFVTKEGIVKTSYDGWNANLASFGGGPGPGHIMNALFFDTTGSLNANYLYRSQVPGRPELNQMNTAIDFNGHDADNVNTVNAQVANVQSVNANAVSAQSVTTNTLATSGNANVGGALTVNGAMTAAGPMTAQSSFMANGAATVGSNLTVGGAASVTGNITSSGNTSAQRFIPSTGFVINTACSPNGAIGSDGSGKTLSCQGGIWKVMGAQTLTAMDGCGPGSYPAPSTAASSGTIESVYAGTDSCGYQYYNRYICIGSSWVNMSDPHPGSTCSGQ